MKEYLLVYGSLRSSGEVPKQIAGLVNRFNRLGRATVHGRLFDFGNYSGAVLDDDTTMMIHGELVELPSDNDVLAALDRYEEIDPLDPANSLFARKQTTTRLADGSKQNAWIFVYNKPVGDAPLIEGGDYIQYRSR